MAIGTMEVVLGNAKGLGDTDFLGILRFLENAISRMDPYVIMQYKGQERKSSVAREQGSNPEWNEKFTFRVQYPGSGQDFKLVLKIMDKDTFSADDFIGQTTIYVQDLLALGAEKGVAELHPQKYRVVRADQSYVGEIQVGVNFTRKAEHEHDGGEVGGWKQSHHHN